MGFDGESPQMSKQNPTHSDDVLFDLRETQSQWCGVVSLGVDTFPRINSPFGAWELQENHAKEDSTFQIWK